MKRKIILASKSPRRIELFEKYGIEAESCPAEIDEAVPEELSVPEDIVKYLAGSKAEHIAKRTENGTVIVAADTLVFCGGRILGKPSDRNEAREMLRLLSGASHSVVSGLCVTDGEKTVSESVTTLVTFRELSHEETEAYISTNEPYDKAGGYGIQSLAGAFVSEIKGDYYNVVGLPVARLLEILKRDFGVDAFTGLCRKMGGGNG